MVSVGYRSLLGRCKSNASRTRLRCTARLEHCVATAIVTQERCVTTGVEKQECCVATTFGTQTLKARIENAFAMHRRQSRCVAIVFATHRRQSRCESDAFATQERCVATAVATQERCVATAVATQERCVATTVGTQTLRRNNGWNADPSSKG